jgi:Xaa-Pro aminopeptidase
VVERYFPVSEYETRWQRVSAEMKRRGFETAVIWGRTAGTYCRAGDLIYLVNYYGNGSGQGYDTPIFNARSFAAIIFRVGESPEVICDQAWPRKDLISTDKVRSSRNTIKAVADLLKEQGVEGPVALAGTDFLPMKYWSQLEAATPEIDWVPADDLVRNVRKVKSPRELECYREAGRIVTRALDKLMEGLLTGKSEAEAAGEAAREVVKSGGAIHMIPCSHGEFIEYFCRNPLPGYGLDAPKPGDLVRGWVYGPIFQGYYLDPGRTAVCGKRPSNAQRELIETCANIIEKVIAALRPGADLMAVARMGDQLLKDAGAEEDQASAQFPVFGHSVGHFFEPPYIGTQMGSPGDTLEENMVMGVEAFLGRKGVGSAGFEQNVIVTKDGTELITTSPMLLY